VQNRRDFSDDLFAVTLIHPENRTLPAYRSGQYLTVLVEREGQPPLRRCYSLAAWDKRPARYELAIRHLPSDCRAGHCGACRLTVAEGRTRWLVPPEYPVAGNEILACCTVPESDLRLVR